MYRRTASGWVFSSSKVIMGSWKFTSSKAPQAARGDRSSTGLSLRSSLLRAYRFWIPWMDRTSVNQNRSSSRLWTVKAAEASVRAGA